MTLPSSGILKLSDIKTELSSSSNSLRALSSLASKTTPDSFSDFHGYTAPDYYVDPVTGNDADNGTTPALAWETIDKAVSTVAAGDVVEFIGTVEIVNEPFQLETSGTSGNPIIFRCEEGEQTTIRRNTSRTVYGNSYDYVEFYGFKFIGKTWANLTDSVGIVMEDCHFEHYNIEIAYADHPPIDLGGCSYCVIRNCWVEDGYKNYSDSIEFNGNTHHNLIEGCYFLEGEHTAMLMNGNNTSGSPDGTDSTQPRWNVIRNNYFFSQYHHATNFQVGARNNLVEGNFFERAGAGYWDIDGYHDGNDIGAHIYGNSDGITRGNVFLKAGRYDPASKSAAQCAGHAYNNTSTGGNKNNKNERVYNNVFYNSYGLAFSRGAYVENNNSPQCDASGNKHYNNIIYYNGESSLRSDYAHADTEVVIYYHNSGTYALGKTAFDDEWENNVIEDGEDCIRGDGASAVSISTVEDTGLSGYTNLVWNNNLTSNPLLVDPTSGWTSIFTSGGNSPVYNSSANRATNMSKFGLQSGSPCKNGGRALTTTNGTSSGTVVPVNDSLFFAGGSNSSNWNGIIEGDNIKVGSNSVQIVSIDYSTHQITVDSSISWTDGDDVTMDYIYSSPSIGIEY